MVARPTSKTSAISWTLRSRLSYISRAWQIVARVIFDFALPRRPRALAAAGPAVVGSTMRPCSNSAMAASMWKNSFPPGAHYV